MIHMCSFQQSTEASPTIYNGIGSLTNISGQNINFNAALDNTSGLKISTNRRVEGSPFLCNEWHWGYIRFPNGAVVDSIQLRFNAITNELCFLDKTKVYCLDKYYSEFGYVETDREESPKRIFRTGFPVTGANNEKTNYQILVAGTYILLKTVKKELQENRSLDGQSYYRVAEEIDHFVFNSSDKTMVILKKTLQQLSSELPVLKQSITDYCNNNKQKCKTEVGLIEFFSAMNKETQKPF